MLCKLNYMKPTCCAKHKRNDIIYNQHVGFHHSLKTNYYMMKIIQNLFILFALLLTTGFSNITTAQAKPGEQFRNKIQAQRVAFYTQQMNITPVEAQQFWPVYNEYLEKKNKLAAEKRKLTKFYTQNSGTMTENDIDVTINKYVMVAKEETQLFEDYNKRFRKILPAKKVMRLYLAEIEFKTWLLGQIREKSNKLEELPE